MYAEYLHEYTDDLERVLSLGYHCGYSASALERKIAYSSFFKARRRWFRIAPDCS